MKVTQKIKIKNDLGLHIRPATSIVRLLQSYKSNVWFTYKKETINARSILSILMLAAKRNAQIKVTIEGEDASKVLKALIQMFENNFGESCAKK